MKHFSFLLGSGFSIPDGYPSTSQLNEKLKKINADEIMGQLGTLNLKISNGN